MILLACSFIFVFGFSSHFCVEVFICVCATCLKYFQCLAYVGSIIIEKTQLLKVSNGFKIITEFRQWICAIGFPQSSWKSISFLECHLHVYPVGSSVCDQFIESSKRRWKKNKNTLQWFYSMAQNLPSSLHMIVTCDLFSGMWTQNLKDHWNKTENMAEKKWQQLKHTIRIWDDQVSTMRWEKIMTPMMLMTATTMTTTKTTLYVYWCATDKLAAFYELLGKFTQKHRPTDRPDSTNQYYIEKASVRCTLQTYAEATATATKNVWNELEYLMVVFTVSKEREREREWIRK